MKSPRSSSIALASLLAVVAPTMSRVATVLICAAISVCTLMGPNGLYAQSGGNVLLNGSFEDNTTGSDAPDGWTRRCRLPAPSSHATLRSPATACGACGRRADRERYRLDPDDYRADARRQLPPVRLDQNRRRHAVGPGGRGRRHFVALGHLVVDAGAHGHRRLDLRQHGLQLRADRQRYRRWAHRLLGRHRDRHGLVRRPARHGDHCRSTRTPRGTCSCSSTTARTLPTRISSAPITWWVRFHRSRSPPRRLTRRGSSTPTSLR